MAPSGSRAKSESTPVAGPSKERPHKKSGSHPYSRWPRATHWDEDTSPGVQKLKSALRQTKRLLAKDNLAADVRVETERRLKALEGDLVRAGQSRKERQHAAKYHKVKFFERQKVVRKIKQTKRSIAASDAKEKEELESVLADLRVDLNYILNFPKTRKYISLFPPEVRSSGSTAAPVAAASDDNEERAKVREMIRQQMERGGLSNEPENGLGKLGRENKELASGRRNAGVAPSIKASTYTDGVASDDFFGDDDEEDSEQSEASDS